MEDEEEDEEEDEDDETAAEGMMVRDVAGARAAARRPWPRGQRRPNGARRLARGERAVLVARRAADLHGLRDLEARWAVDATGACRSAGAARCTPHRHKDVDEPQRQAVRDGVLLGGRDVRPLAEAVVVLVTEVDVRQ